MKKLIIAIILLLFGSKMVFGQNYFDNYYSYKINSEFNNYLHLLTNGNYVTVGIASNGSEAGLILRQINSNGEIFKEYFIEHPLEDYSFGISFIDNSILLNDNTVIILGASINKGGTSLTPFFLKYDLKAEAILNIQYYKQVYDGILYTSVLHTDGYIYSGGRCYVDSDEGTNETDLFLIKLDTMGNEIWRKTFNYTDKDFVYSIESFKNNIYITYNDRNSITYVAKLDTSGTLLNTKKAKVRGSTGIDKIEAYNNKLFLLNSTNEEHITYRTTYLAELDEDLNIIWEKYLPNTSKYSLHYRCMNIANDEIVLSGVILDTNEFTKGPINACASAYDLQGNLLWEHIYDHDTTFLHHLDDVVADENGDLIFMGTISGRTETANGSFLWLFKTDSEGCGTVQEVCYNSIEDYAIASGLLIDVPENELNNFNLVEILGNPFSSNLKLHTINNKPFQLKFYNTAGKLVRTENINHQLTLNTQNWPAGIYFMQVYDEDELLGVKKLVKQ